MTGAVFAWSVAVGVLVSGGHQPSHPVGTSLERTGGSAGIMIDAPAVAGGVPAVTVFSNQARLRWVSEGTNKIEVRLDPLSDAIPGGLRLFVSLGGATPIEIYRDGGWVTLLPNITDASGDEALVYSVAIDPADALIAGRAVTLDVAYRISPELSDMIP